MKTIALRGWLIVVLSGFAASGASAQQAGGRDIVQLDTSNLTPAQVQGLRDRLGDQLFDDTGRVLIAPRDEFADVLQALQWPGLRPQDGVALNPLREFDDRQILLKRVFGPVGAASAIEFRVKQMRTACLLKTQADSDAYRNCTQGLAELQKVVTDLKASDPDCQPAARAYLDYQSACEFSCPADGASIKRNFDAACLLSTVSWRRADGAYRRDAQPPVFLAGGSQAGVSGAMDAIVLVEKDDDGKTLHHCGGLLLSGNRVLTAAHCFVSPGDQAALQAGRMFARLIRQDGPRYPLLPSSALVSTMPAVAKDYLVLGFQAATAVPAPRIEFREPGVAGPALVLGYFTDYDSSRVVQAQDVGGNPLRVPTWKLGLRWAKPGMCHVIETVQGCVRTLCQTIPGYSGAPVFAPQASPDAPLVVYGVISGPDSSAARCGKVEPLTTLAASAKDVQP